MSEKERWMLVKKEVEEKTFFLLDVGSGYHDKPSFRVWVSPKLVVQSENGYFLELPTQNIELVKGKKDLILRPGKRNLFNAFCKCGYRGESKLEVLTPGDVFEYEVWSSPLGNLGISRGALVVTENDFVKYRWKRTGRTYGSPTEGVTVVYIDGRSVDLGEEEDALASLSE